MGQPGIISQKVQHLFFPDLGTVQLTIGFKSIAGPQKADPVAFSLGRIFSSGTVRFEKRANELDALDETPEAHEVPSCVLTHRACANAVEELHGLDDVPIQHGGVAPPDIDERDFLQAQVLAG